MVITPFGRPVVPEVKIRSERSSGETASARGPGLLLGDGVASGEKVGPGGRSRGRLAQDDDAFEVGQVLAPQRLDVVHAEELPHGAQDAGAALAQHVAGLRPLQARVQRDEHAAGGLQTDGRDDPLGDVGRPDADPVSRLDARGAEGAGGSQPRVRQLGEGEPEVCRLRRRSSRRSARPTPARVGGSSAPWDGPHRLFREPPSRGRNGVDNRRPGANIRIGSYRNGDPASRNPGGVDRGKA